MTGGATAAECVVREGDEFSTLVRLGQVETLKESGSKSIGVRVFFGQRAASTYSSDFSREGLDRMVKSALELAKITSEDPFGGIPAADQLGQTQGRSRSLSRRRLLAARRRPHRLRPPHREGRARLRSAHQELRRRIVRRRHRTQSPRQLARIRRRIFAVVLLRGRCPDRADRRWSDAARLLVLGRAHAEETRQSRRRWAESPPNARSDAWARAKRRPREFRSSSIPWSRRRSSSTSSKASTETPSIAALSFLAGKLGQKIAGDNVTVIDDGTIPGGFGTSPFDGEGIPTRRTVVIENGVLKSYLLNTYTAKKLGLQTTGECLARIGWHSGHRPGKLFPAGRARNLRKS